MVKVTIDNKEHEGTEISFYDNQDSVKRWFNDGDKHELIFKDESQYRCPDCKKEYRAYYEAVNCNCKEICVPKEIQFVKQYPYNMSSNPKLALQIENHALMYKEEVGWEFRAVSNSQIEDAVHVDCVLIPVKRSDLKPGDWAIRIKEHALKDEVIRDWALRRISEYHLILNDKKTVYIDNNDFVGEIIHYNSHEWNWFKVVQRGETK